MAIDRDALPYGRTHAYRGNNGSSPAADYRLEAGRPSTATDRSFPSPSSSSSSPGAASVSTDTEGVSGSADAAETIFGRIIGASSQYLMSSFYTQASPPPDARGGGSVTPTQSDDSLEGYSAASATAAFGTAIAAASSARIPGPATDSSITPLEIGQGPTSDHWHERSLRRRSVSKDRAGRRGRASKWSPCMPVRLTRRQLALCGIACTVLLIVLIVLIAAAAKRRREDLLFPGSEQGGAAVTGNYRNLFTEFLGKTPQEVDAKLDSVWTQLFHGDPDTEAIYVEVGPDMAQVINTEADVVTSEGISYGMTAAVHLDHREEFDRLWNWARFRMQQTAGDFSTFFVWRVTRSGMLIDAKDVIPAPDAEAFIAAALIAAHRKWGSTVEYPYRAEALRLLDAMGDPDKRFFTRDGKVTFNPTDWGQTHSNPSYHLPHFWDMYARFLQNEGAPPSTVAFWRRAATQSRRFFRRAAHPKTALMPDYTTIDGKRAPDPNLGGHVNFQWDAWRAPANVAVDWSWWQADGWQMKFADRFLRFFKSKGPHYESLWTVEGKVAPPKIGHDMGLVAMNAAVALASRRHKVLMPFLGEMWDRELPTGPGRYYPSSLAILSLLHLSGKFQAYY